MCKNTCVQTQGSDVTAPTVRVPLSNSSGTTRRSRQGLSSRYCTLSQEVEHAGTHDSLYRNQEGTFRRRGTEDPARVYAARALRTRCGRLRGADRQAPGAAPLRL